MSIRDKVDLNILRYANCWEDADILLEGLGLPPNKRLLCIASAGDNALALLSASPELVHAVDLSLPQLYLTELKQACFSSLEHESTLGFLGVIPLEERERIKIYRHLGTKLSKSAALFFNDRLQWIEEGVIHQGKFEKYFSFFRKYLMPLVHSSEKIKKMFSFDSVSDLGRFYDAEWNTWRWRLLMNTFFSRAVMGKYGRDPEFFRHVNLPVSKYIRERAGSALSTMLPSENFILDMIFNGNFNHALPFYLREENYDLIRNNIHRLSLSATPAETAIREKQYHAYALSNIFEYISVEEFKAFVREVSPCIQTGSRLAFWNLMAPRSFADTDPSAFKRNKEASEMLSAKDKGFFYNRFLVEEKN